MIKFLVVVLLSIVTVGCATAPEQLANSDRTEQIVLMEKVSTVSYRGMHVRCEEGALPGVYSAWKEDADGIYFLGAGRPIWSTNEIVQPQPRLWQGGIYLPHQSSEEPRFFYVFETDVHTADNIDNYISRRAISTPVNSSVSSTAGDAIGGAIGGALISAMIQADIGKIVMVPVIEDAEVKRQLFSARKSTIR